VAAELKPPALYAERLSDNFAIPKIPPLLCFAKRRGLRDTLVAQAASPKIDIRFE